MINFSEYIQSTMFWVIFTTAFGSAISSPMPLTYTDEVNDITDIILERTKQIVISHHKEVIPIPDLDIAFKQGISRPEGIIEAKNGGFRGLDTLERESDAFLIRTSDEDLKLVALMKMNTMAYFYNDYKIALNETVQSGSLNVVIKENLVKMDLHLTMGEDCTFELSDLNIKIANNYTVQMSLIEMHEMFYQELVNWACENYLTVIADSVRQALYENINQALHDLEICHFIVSPNGLADLLPKKRLDLPYFTFSMN